MCRPPMRRTARFAASRGAEASVLGTTLAGTSLVDVHAAPWQDEVVRITARGWLSFVLLVLSACGGKSSRTEPQRCGPPHDFRQAEEAFVLASCDMLVRCGFYADARSCAESGDRLPPLFDHARSGCAAVDMGELLRCADQLREGDCRLETYFAAIETCMGAIKGTLEAGAECEQDFECVSGACEMTACGEACCVGTCASRDLPQGSSCVSDTDCAPGTYCASEGNLCTPLLPVGSRCNSASECEADLGCHAGVCRPSAAEGEPCEPGFFACDVLHDRCDDALARCVPASLLGEPCSGSALGGDCVGTAWCDRGRCQPLPSAGEPCVEGVCLDSNVCDADSMVCEPPAAPRERCP